MNITKTGPTAVVEIGANFDYTLTAANAGPEDSTAMVIEDQCEVIRARPEWQHG